MEQHHKDIIRGKYTNLIEDISESIEHVCFSLHQKGIISRDMKDDILVKSTASRQAEALLDKIVRRGPKAFDALYDASIKHGLYTTANILKKENAPHEPSSKEEDEMQDDMPDDSEKQHKPDDFYTEKVKLEVRKMENKKLYDEHIDNIGFYQMTSVQRGRPLVLYDKKELHNTDKRRIDELFRNLNFESLKKIKVKGIEELNQLKSVGNCDCLILFVISSGFLKKKETITKIDSIVKDLDNLVGKPKLVFHVTVEADDIQTENGGGRLVPDGDNDEEKPNGIDNEQQDVTKALKMKSPQPQQTEVDKTINGSEAKGTDTVDGPVTNTKIARDCDVYTITSIGHGCKSAEESGEKFNWFIRRIVTVFSRDAYKSNIKDLIREVNQGSMGPVAAVTGDSMRKTLHFFPGC